ncbi:MAG: PD-(D/E)XK nuclease family protein, partial [Bacteroidetes bacterium]|nr:PD-(D/E)XK nuclease family protein [Bacteroidota bacterium]
VQYRQAADAVATMDLSRYHSIVLAGFFAFTQTEETIVRHLLTLPQVTMLFQDGEGIRSTLETLGLDPAPEGESVPPLHLYYESPDAHGQLTALNRILSERFPEPVKESDRAAVVLPSSENLFPLYHQTLSMYDQQTYNLALGYPLSRTPVNGFLTSLLDVVVSARNGEVFVPKYLQFLLHPYTKNILFGTRTDVTRILMHMVEEDSLRHASRLFIAPERIEGDPHLMASVVQRLAGDGEEVTAEELRAHLASIHAATIAPFLSVTTVGGFAAACIGVLQYINDRSTAHRHPYFRPFVETLIDALDALRRSLLADHSFSKPEHYLLLYRHITSGADVPFTGTPLQGLQVLGFLETRGLQFADIFMIDVNDDVLPGKVQQDVLLPLTIREQLGLSTYRDQERIKAYIFDVLRRGAERVHLFSINNNEKERSRFIAQLQWDEQRSRRSLDPVDTFTQEYAIDLSVQSPAAVPKSAGMQPLLSGMQFSSTALDTYLTCGVKFYYRYVMRLKERGELSGDLEQSDVGKIVHAILQEFFAPAMDRPLTEKDLDRQRLSRVVEENFRSAYGSTQFGEQFFAKRQVEKQLVSFLENFQRPHLENGEVVIEMLEREFTAEIGGFDLTGNADRIEQRDGKHWIIDYKTGQHEKNYLVRFDALNAGDRSTWKEAIGSLQLAMYVMLYSEMRQLPPEQIVPAFQFLGKKEMDGEIEVPLFSSPEEMQQWYPVLKQIVLSLMQEIVDPAVPFQPTDDPKSDCPDCPYRTLCGTQWAEKFKSF